MRGKVVRYDAASQSGEILGDDEETYAFDLSALGRRAPVLAPGDMVDFAPGGGRASNIIAISEAGGKSRVLAGILAVFLGVFGVHKFYLGRHKAGVVMMLVFVIGLAVLGAASIPSVAVAAIAFAEFIIYLTKSDEDFHRDYVVGDRAWF
ncbi:MAG: TM2 domain-containing protein [Pseudomonadota bacterium]